ncbi:MAG TPA: class I SAM-dependent methyltransferase [Kribbella sp.]|uniref:class I SAM-dependent methyltransferase n=1 Tax=Kribbella sp. TaxID=1871183 RepID=UPI002D77ECD5|nr:class I SAM-dependent methyltransferase [Kribbella sp.]HET6295841.1 class I SAM-dependent methyltransferase [Kribbella sp.]
MTTENLSAEEMWNARYAESGQIWSGRPNVVLVQEAAELEPGRALDLGSGEGGDAIWLAQRGWQVTAVDVSSVALGRAAEHAAAAGVADRIDWQQHELGKSFPDGSYDLVSAQFLHSTGNLPREEILRTAAAAVAPGGILLIEGHLDFGAWHHADHADVHFPTPAEVIADLELADGEWEVLVSTEHEREQDGPDGKPTTRTDATVKVRRLPS